MTFYEATDMAYNIAVGHRINGEPFTKTRFREQVRRMLNVSSGCGSSRYIFFIELPDGEWLCEIIYDKRWGYWFNLPETRKAEERLYEALGIVVEHGGGN